MTFLKQIHCFQGKIHFKEIQQKCELQEHPQNTKKEHSESVLSTSRQNVAFFYTILLFYLLTLQQILEAKW